MRQFRSSGIGQHTRTPTHTTPQLANDVALHRIGSSGLLCFFVAVDPPSLCFCLRATLFATHRRDRRTNTYIVRAAPLRNLRAHRRLCSGGGRGCLPHLGISRDCAVQNYVCRELLIQVRELLTRYYENRSKFPAKPGKFPASKIPAEGRNPRLSTGNFCRELLFGNFYGPCAAWRPLARSASRLVTGLVGVTNTVTVTLIF